MNVSTRLEVKDLHTHFCTNQGVVKALNGIDFIIPRGGTVGLVGESGCGKSITALSIMRLIQQPPGQIAKGQIIFDDLDLLQVTESKMRQIRGNRMAMVFQEPMTSLNPVYRVGNQVAEAVRIHQKLPKREALAVTIEMLKKVGIPDPNRRVKDYPHEMSGGMRQRIMISIALSCKPDLIICDEPTTALDVTVQAQILELIEELRNDICASLFLISHDLGVIAEMAQTVIVMYAGKIVEYAKVNDLFEEPRHPYTIGLLNSIPKTDAPDPAARMLQTIPGLVPTLFNLPAGCYFENRCSKVLGCCASEEPPLVDLGSGHRVRCWRYV
jgi:peptide/nickel transport system ATP-binding protein/oligopeptide transport system ATP-binding protein